MATDNASVHYLGIVGTAAMSDHRLCPAQWERIKRERSDEYGPDGAYNQGGCVHGQEFEGRGDDVSGAANGQQGGVDYNPGSRSICIMVGTDDEIPAACVDLIQRWYERQLANGKSAPLRAHSEFVATACPGDNLRGVIATINSGTWHTPSPPKKKNEADMAVIALTPFGNATRAVLTEAGIAIHEYTEAQVDNGFGGTIPKDARDAIQGQGYRTANLSGDEMKRIDARSK